MEIWNLSHDPKISLMMSAALKEIRRELDRLYWNLHQEEMNSPFDNTGASYKNDYVEINAYYWGDDYALEERANFQTKDIKVYWYKHEGRTNSVYFKDKDTRDKLNVIAEVLEKSLKSIRADFEKRKKELSE